jgi:hypothetical protein
VFRLSCHLGGVSSNIPLLSPPDEEIEREGLLYSLLVASYLSNETL